MKNKRYYLIVSTILIIILLAIGPRANFQYTLKPVTIPQQVDQYISASENKYSDIRPGTEKKIFWANSDSPSTTPFSIVYLHGFSASRQEVAPLCDMLAKQISANLYYTRLTGHGRSSDAMQEVTVDTLVNDAKEAFEIGKRIGNKVILVGSSTGGTLATWISTQANNDPIAAIILLSPNFGLKRKESELLLYPWGKTILQLLEGDYYSFTPANTLQEKYWTTRYPTNALLSMMGFVDLARRNASYKVNVPALVLYSEKDKIVDIESIKSQFQQFASPIKKLVAISGSTDPQQHILAGDALSPSSTNEVLQTTLEFLMPIVKL